MKDVEIIGMLKSYISKTLVGMGALKGAPCEVQGTHDEGDGTQTLTLQWKDTDGVTHTTDIVLPAAIFAILNPSNGQTLRYNSVSGKFENSNVSFSADLEDLDNVVITSVQDGQVLTYDAANNRWINSNGSTVASMEDLTDVTITTIQNGQILVYDSSISKWVNISLADVATSGEASDVSYDNTTSGMVATDAQAAIDELKAETTQIELDISQLSASNIGFDGTASGLSATDAQGAIDELADEKVDKVSGKGLSQNDFTDALKSKLDDIETNADVNVIEEVKVNGTALTPDANKAVNIEEKVSKLSDVDLTGLGDGYILIYDATNSKWIVGANTGASYTAGEGIEIDQNNVISSKIVMFTGTKNQWNALTTAEKTKFTHASFIGDTESGIVDAVPTQDSDNLVKSGGVFSALTNKADTTDVYAIVDATDTSIDNADYIPFYDTSAGTKKKIAVSDMHLGGGSGGSLLTITTQESDLHGKTVNVTDGVLTFTGTFNNSGVAIIEGVTITGHVTISCVGTSETASMNYEMPYYGSYSPELNFYTIYGFHVNSSNPNPSNAVSYKVQYEGRNVANYSYKRAFMDFEADIWEWGDWSENDFFMPKPCLVKQDYSDIIYLDPSDYTKDTEGNDVSAILTGSTDGYNAMMEWGKNGRKIWYKLVPDSGDATSYTVYISDVQVDSGFKAWSFYDANNNMADHFYTSIYAGSTVSNVLRSLSGKTRNNTTAGATQITQAKANNKNSEAYAWYIDVYADRVLINLLLILVIKSLNSDLVGYGNYTGGTSASSLLTTGAGNTKGMFYGKQSNSVCKVFGMENWFADAWRRMAGLVLNNGVQLYKLTYGTADGSSAAGYIESDSAPSNYLTGNTIATNLSSSYIAKETAKTDGSLLASGFSGANATYYSDGCWSSTGAKYAHVGGACAHGSTCGAFALNLSYALSDSAWSFGCALSLKPLAQ